MWWHRGQDKRIKESEQAIARTKRLAKAVEFKIEEASAVTDWAQRRLEQNHLAELFMQGRKP